MARATKDIDIVLSVEALSDEFVSHFWAFVRAGGHNAIRQSTGERRFYRFTDPTDLEYHKMLEILSNRPVIFEMGEAKKHKNDIKKFVDEIVDEDTFLRTIEVRDLSMHQIKEALLKVYCTD